MKTKMAQVLVNYCSKFLLLPTDERGKPFIPPVDQFSKYGIPDKAVVKIL